MNDNVLNFVNGSKVNMKKELSNVAWNRRVAKVIDDYSCLDCHYFGTHCADKAGLENFKCPLEDTSSTLYADYVVRNYADLCVVVDSPSVDDWKKSTCGKSGLSKLHSIKRLMFTVSMPKTEILNAFIKSHSIKDEGLQSLCSFSALDLRRRLREMLLYKVVKYSPSNIIATQLVKLLIPNEFQDMFTFRGNNSNGEQD